MLKIKDNVDLKELEKFGLKPHYKISDETTGKVSIDYYSSSKYECRWGYMRLKPKKKYLCFRLPSKYFENHIKATPLFIEDETYLDMDLLYDLIQADLVEKVEDK